MSERDQIPNLRVGSVTSFTFNGTWFCHLCTTTLTSWVAMLEHTRLLHPDQWGDGLGPEQEAL